MTKKKSETPMVIVPDLKKLGLEETKASEIKALFDPMLKKMTTYEKEYNKIIKAEISKDTAEAARKLRLKYVKVRTGTAKIHKEAKAYHLAAGRALDGFLNAQKFAGAEIEEKLAEIENYEAAKKQAEIDKKTTDRRWKMGEFGMSTALMPPNVGEWEDDIWNDYIAAVEAKWKKDQEEALQARKKAAAAHASEVLSGKKPVAPHAGDGSPHPHELTGEEPAYVAQINDDGTDTPLNDKSRALQLILDLNELSNKYTFEGDQYKFAYSKMKERFAKMEQYLRMLNRSQ